MRFVYLYAVWEVEVQAQFWSLVLQGSLYTSSVDIMHQRSPQVRP